MGIGRATGHRLKELIKPGTSHDELPGQRASLGRLDHFRYADGDTPTAALRADMQKTMTRHAAVFRDSKLMAEGVENLPRSAWPTSRSTIAPGLERRSDRDAPARRSYGATKAHGSAENRKESRGAHAHEDFPDRNDAEWMKHHLLVRRLGRQRRRGEIDYRPVHEYMPTDDVKYIEPKKRVY